MASRTEGDGSRRGSAQAAAQPGVATVTGGRQESANLATPPGGTGRPMGPSTGYAYTPRPFSNVNVDTSSLTGISGASNYGSATWNQEESRKDAYLQWNDLDAQTQAQLTAIAKANGGRSGKIVWETAVDQSEASVRAGKPATPWDFLNVTADQAAKNPSTGGGRSGGGSRGGGGGGVGGGYSGPNTSVSRQFVDRATLTDLADQIGMEMLGRGVSKSEMDRIEKRIRVYEQNHPDTSISQSGVGASASSSTQGASTSGRQDVIQNILAKNPQYGDYQKATTMMNWFDAALADRSKNG